MRKWQYLVKALRIKEAPTKVINAAREIDLELIVLGFNSFEWRSYKDGIFAKDENWKDINDIVYDRDNCSTCCDCDHNCECCRLGDQEHCTPRSKHADDYFVIVSNYIHNKMREACIIIDWQQPKEHIATEIEENHFKFKPIPIYTKDGFNFEMDARMILQIDNDDDSIIVENLGSFSVFIENTLTILIRNFFTDKEKGYIFSNRIKIQEELVEKLQKELIKYNAKIQKFIISYMLVPSPYFDKK